MSDRYRHDPKLERRMVIATVVVMLIFAAVLVQDCRRRGGDPAVLDPNPEGN